MHDREKMRRLRMRRASNAKSFIPVTSDYNQPTKTELREQLAQAVRNTIALAADTPPRIRPFKVVDNDRSRHGA